MSCLLKEEVLEEDFKQARWVFLLARHCHSVLRRLALGLGRWQCESVASSPTQGSAWAYSYGWLLRHLSPDKFEASELGLEREMRHLKLQRSISRTLGTERRGKVDRCFSIC